MSWPPMLRLSSLLDKRFVYFVSIWLLSNMVVADQPESIVAKKSLRQQWLARLLWSSSGLSLPRW